MRRRPRTRTRVHHAMCTIECGLCADMQVRILLDNGADPNLLSVHKSTALMLASASNHTGVVRELLRKHAATHLQDEVRALVCVLVRACMPACMPRLHAMTVSRLWPCGLTSSTSKRLTTSSTPHLFNVKTL